MIERNEKLTARVRAELARTKAFRSISKRFEDGRVDVTGAAVPARALFSRLPRPSEFVSRIVSLQEGAELEMRELLERMIENGFVRTDLVGEAGEFAFRGGILDLFPPNTAKPVRIELFGDNVDSMRWFEVETQRSEDAAGP